jgi:hypothetical protein
MRNLDWLDSRRRLGDWLCALLLAAALLIALIPVTIADDNESAVGPKAATQGVSRQVLIVPQGPPPRITQHLFNDNSACSNAKLDVWFERGRHTFSVFMVGDGLAQRADSRPDPDGTTILLGNEGCRYRIRIEKADQGTADPKEPDLGR